VSDREEINEFDEHAEAYADGEIIGLTHIVA
jgi:hypothetical protein